jgi:hypothetical protein
MNQNGISHLLEPWTDQGDKWRRQRAGSLRAAPDFSRVPRPVACTPLPIRFAQAHQNAPWFLQTIYRDCTWRREQILWLPPGLVLSEELAWETDAGAELMQACLGALEPLYGFSSEQPRGDPLLAVATPQPSYPPTLAPSPCHPESHAVPALFPCARRRRRPSWDAGTRRRRLRG